MYPNPQLRATLQREAHLCIESDLDVAEAARKTGFLA